MRLKDLEDKIDGVIEDLQISDKFKSWAIRYLHETRQNEAKSNLSVFENKQKSLIRVTEQLHNLLLKYTAPENADEKIMTSQELQSVKLTLLNQKAALENDLKAQGKDIEEWVATTERTFTFARYAQMWFNKTDDMDRKRAIFAALGSHLIIKDQNLNVTLHPYFKTIFEKRDKVEKEISKVRTSKIEQNTREFAKTMAECPTLRRRWDLNPRDPFRSQLFPLLAGPRPRRWPSFNNFWAEEARLELARPFQVTAFQAVAMAAMRLLQSFLPYYKKPKKQSSQNAVDTKANEGVVFYKFQEPDNTGHSY